MNTHLLKRTFVMQQTHGQGKKRPYCLMKIFFGFEPLAKFCIPPDLIFYENIFKFLFYLQNINPTL